MIKDKTPCTGPFKNNKTQPSLFCLRSVKTSKTRKNRKETFRHGKTEKRHSDGQQNGHSKCI